MGVARALVVVVLIALATSPLVSGTFNVGSAVPSVYADSPSSSLVIVRDKNDKDQDRKNKNRDSDEDSRGNRIKTRDEQKEEKDQQSKDDDQPRTPTNTLARDNFELEGQVVALNCDANPKEITIHTVDGDAKLFQGPRDPHSRIDRLYCGDLLVGDYIFVQEAQKRNEQEYDAFYISCQKDRQEGDDNSNDNDDDVDPNCQHIWHR
ncbi:MAG: hypothetical protein U0893_21155 [Chloroflexota bacterium]